MEKIINKAIENIPKKEFDHFKKVYNSIDNKKLDDNQIKMLLISVRYKNPICQNCKNKGKDLFLKFFLCNKCKLVFYCSEECQQNNFIKHKKYCCNIDFDYKLEDDFYIPVILKIEMNKKSEGNEIKDEKN